MKNIIEIIGRTVIGAISWFTLFRFATIHENQTAEVWFFRGIILTIVGILLLSWILKEIITD